MRASKRARKADDEASSWHQGSGTHTCACAGICEMLEQKAGLPSPREEGEDENDWSEIRLRVGVTSKQLLSAAKLWADAAVVEAVELRKTSGEWLPFRAWKKSPSGKATDKAVKATKKLIFGFKWGDWC